MFSWQTRTPDSSPRRPCPIRQDRRPIIVSPPYVTGPEITSVTFPAPKRPQRRAPAVVARRIPAASGSANAGFDAQRQQRPCRCHHLVIRYTCSTDPAGLSPYLHSYPRTCHQITLFNRSTYLCSSTITKATISSSVLQGPLAWQHTPSRGSASRLRYFKGSGDLISGGRGPSPQCSNPLFFVGPWGCNPRRSSSNIASQKGALLPSQGCALITLLFRLRYLPRTFHSGETVHPDAPNHPHRRHTCVPCSPISLAQHATRRRSQRHHSPVQ